jgi:hypothetical protein
MGRELGALLEAKGLHWKSSSLTLDGVRAMLHTTRNLFCLQGFITIAPGRPGI